MFLDVIDKRRQLVLDKLSSLDFLQDFYLAGGTALALQLGHRESVDFDWFSDRPFNPADIENLLASIGDVMVTESKKDTLHCIFDEVQVTWLMYRYPLLQPKLQLKANGTAIQMASLTDIGTMKLVAVSQRGARKDFVDLFFLEKAGIPILQLLQQLPTKFPNAKVNYYHIVKSLTFFDDAEQEPMPIMNQDTDWEEIKSFFRTQQDSYFRFITQTEV